MQVGNPFVCAAQTGRKSLPQGQMSSGFSIFNIKNIVYYINSTLLNCLFCVVFLEYFLLKTVRLFRLLFISFPRIVTIATLPQRYIDGLSEVPIRIRLHHSGRDTSLSKQSAHLEPSPHDSFARCPRLSRLRLVGVFHPPLLALRRLAAIVSPAGAAKRNFHSTRHRRHSFIKPRYSRAQGSRERAKGPCNEKAPSLSRGPLFSAPKARTPGRPVLVHAVHAAAVAAGRSCCLLLRNLDNQRFGGQ